MCITLTIGPDAALREQNAALAATVAVQAETIRALLARERPEELRATRSEEEER